MEENKLSEFARIIQEGKKAKKELEENKKNNFLEKYNIEEYHINPINFLSELAKLKKEANTINTEPVEEQISIVEPIVEKPKTPSELLSELATIIQEGKKANSSVFEASKEKLEPFVESIVKDIVELKSEENTPVKEIIEDELPVIENSLIDKAAKSITKTAENTNSPLTKLTEKVTPNLKVIQDKLKHLEQWVGKISAAGPGSGSYWLNDLGDTDKESLLNATDGQVLTFDINLNKWIAAEPQGGGGGGPTIDNYARVTANAAYNQANTANTLAANSYIQVNASFIQANTSNTLATNSYIQANASFVQANDSFIQANSANTLATNSYVQANAAFIQANTANTIAVSSYSAANTKLPLSGGTISGSLVIQNNLTVQGNVSYTGNVISVSVTGNTGQFFGYASNGFNALYAGIPTGYFLEPQIGFQVSSNYDGYSGINMQNINTGANASSDLFLTADNGTISDGFVDLGIASSTYNYPGYSLIGKNDGYLFATGNTTTGGGNMIVGTGLNHDVIFSVGGINTSNEVGRFKYNTGLVLKQFPITFSDGTTQNTSAAPFAFSNAAFNKANSANTLAQSGFDKANSANTLAQSGFDKANTANTLAQGAFDKANTANSETQTLTNKRVTPRVNALANTNSSTYSINTDSFDMVIITGQTASITSITTTGTPTNGQKLWLSITGNSAVGFTLSSSNFEASTVTLPTTTVTTARLDVGFVWNVATSKWRCVAVA